MEPTSDKLRNFIDAFDDHTGACQETCNCGRIFWDNYNSGWSWEEGEIEKLEQNPLATPVEHAVGRLSFEGRYYVNECTCWHPRAKQIMAFIDHHAKEIATYLSLEKKRKQSIADQAPVVE